MLSKPLHDYIAGLSSVRHIGWNGGNVIRIRLSHCVSFS